MRDATMELSVSHYMPVGHGSHADFIAPWARAVEAEARGAASVTVHPGPSRFGRLEDQFDQVMRGAVDVAHSPASLPAGRFPLTGIVGLPFMAAGSLEGGVALGALRALVGREFAGLEVLALHADSGGVLHTRDRPVRRLEDLRGLRLRCTPGPMANVLSLLGAVPVPLAPPQIGRAVAEGAVDGALMAWDVLAYTQTQDALRFHADTRFYVSPLYFVMNTHRYAGLPDGVRGAVDRVSARLPGQFPGWWAEWERHGRALADAPGHVDYAWEEAEVARGREAARPVIAAHLDRLRAAGVVEAWDAYETAVDAMRG